MWTQINIFSPYFFSFKANRTSEGVGGGPWKSDKTGLEGRKGTKMTIFTGRPLWMSPRQIISVQQSIKFFHKFIDNFSSSKEKVKWNDSDREKNKVMLLLSFFSSLLDNANIFSFLLLFSIRIDRWTLRLSHYHTSKDLQHCSCPITLFSLWHSA